MFIIFVGLYCDMNWDNVMCWDAIPAGTTSRMQCPDYINGFSKTGINIVIRHRTILSVLILFQPVLDIFPFLS